MKKIIVLSTTALVSFLTFSALADTPFSTGPAPTQAYHNMSTQSVQSAPAVQSAQPASVTVNAAPADDNNAGFEQTTTQHIQDLDESNQAIGSAIQTIDQNIAQLEQQVNVLQKRELTSSSPFDQLLHGLIHQDLDSFIVFGGTAALLLLFGVLMGRLMLRGKSSLAEVNTDSIHRAGDLLADDAKSDYDFMGTRAAIPAKLDLARSYMAMNDFDQARGVLNTVLEHGDEEQCLVAEALLTKINKQVS